jgi:4-hydroxy-tetrahydrodipicolinate synthase
MSAGVRGVCAAAVTPLDEELRPNAQAAIAYYQSLLDGGCDSLNILGTTGEAMSLCADDRLRFMEALACSGLPRERIMIGTGAAALGDCIRLTSAAFGLGFAAALVMPPFFWRGVSDEGVMHFFDHLLEAVHPPKNGVLLYHYPAVSGIAFHPDLVDRLVTAYHGCIGGIKDSSNDPQFEWEIARRHADLMVFPSSEASLSDARDLGYAGCISGTVALWTGLAARVWAGEAALQSELTRRRELFAKLPIVGGVRYVLAERTGNREWVRCLPPLAPLGAGAVAPLEELCIHPGSRSTGSR